MKKNIYIIILLLFALQIKAQVGINTTSPNVSSVLDINSTNKGVLFPQYDLTVLNSTSTPVANPVDGLMIYNKGGVSTYPKGYYTWIKDQWQRTISVGSEPQNMVLLNNTVTAPNVLIPANSYNNAITNLAVATNKITGASLASDKSTITLPAGTYILRYSVDGGYGTDNTGTTNTQQLSHNFTCTRSYLVNASTNAVLTETNNTCLLSDTFLFFQGTFFLKLTAPTTIKQKFELDTGNGFNRSAITIRSSFSLAITRMAQ
ncbi:hypothetical protein [Chryseobacterium sp. MMS23-Vi53]|uniref:hypothetical protein n=1 Tax=Chryseobacterium sp. MMS23-Vi53 TaxID=3386644 RepID=UPI0039E73A18